MKARSKQNEKGDGAPGGNAVEEEERQRVILELSKLAFSDIGDLFRADGELIPLQDLPPDVAAAVVSIESSEIVTRNGDGDEVLVTRTTKVQLADKLKSLELLGQRLGVFPERSQAEARGGDQA